MKGANSRRRRPEFERRPDRICRTCGIRWSHESGMCRHCQRTDATLSAEREREIVQEIERQEAQRLASVQAPRIPPPIRTVIVEGVAYDVSWDGAVRPEGTAP